MKKSIAIALVLLLILMSVGCGSKEDSKKDTKENNSTSSPQSSNNDSSDDSSDESQEENNGPTVSEIPGSIQMDGMGTIESFITVDDDDDGTNEIVPEFNTQPATVDTAWNSTAPIKKGNTDELADRYRQRILNTKNTLEYYNVKGTIYYVSPNGDDNNDGKSPKTAFKSTRAEIFTRNILKPGDAVLFERGGLWRLTSTIKAKQGVTYGSYGTGEKPTFYCSAYNYADEDFWIPSSKQNIWKVSVSDTDVGIIVFNHGEIVGIKKLNGLVALEKNGDFYFNRDEDLLYIYYDGGNPGKVFDSIEIGLSNNAFSVGVSDVTFDNLRIKYGGSFGISLAGCDNSSITNCEIGFIGGRIQSGTTRLGNGIQVWNGVVNHKVENCWIYQIYDAAVTFQGDYTYQVSNMSDEYINVTYKDNLFEYSTYSVEFWHGTTAPKISPAKIENFNMVDNISRFAGYGWGNQRTDHTGNHICVFERSFPNAKNNLISNNIFDLADSYIVKWGFNAGSDMSGFNITGNTYYHGTNKYNEAMRYGEWLKATNYATLEKAIKIFDSNPKLIKWVG